MLQTINYGLKHGAVFNIACYHENETREITGLVLAKQFEAANYQTKIINKNHLTLVACSPAMTGLLSDYSKRQNK